MIRFDCRYRTGGACFSQRSLYHGVPAFFRIPESGFLEEGTRKKGKDEKRRREVRMDFDGNKASGGWVRHSKYLVVCYMLLEI